MTNSGDIVGVAAVQAAPVFLDRQACVDKACELIAAAATDGARLVVFPEAFVPGYPDWVWLVPGAKKPLLDEMYGELLSNSVAVPGPEIDELCRAAKSAGVYVAIGVNERNSEASGASLYNTLIYIGPDGALLGKHRKLIPTGAERLVWAQGDGSTLDAYDTELGKLGGLLCWENYMPLARYAFQAAGTEILVAPTWDSSSGWLTSMQHNAKEGGMFVISCCTALPMDAVPDRYEFKALYPEGREWVNKGNSCIVDPKGNLIAGPEESKETILHAELDTGLIPAAKWIFDAGGHYARPDVFRFAVNRAPNPIVEDFDENPG